MAPLAVTAAFRILLALTLPVAPRWDGFFYTRYAARLAEGRGYVDVGTHGALHPTAFYPVGYPAALAPFVRWLGDAQWAVFTLNLVASLVACFAVMKVTAHLHDERAARRAGYLYALLPGPALWCLAAMNETVTSALLVVALAAALSQHTWGRMGAGLSLGLATLVRPPSLLVALGSVWMGASRRARLVSLAVTLALAGLVIAPMTARNCAVLDRCAMVSTNGGINLFIGSLPEAGGGFVTAPWLRRCEEADGEVARDRCHSAEARARIAAHPARWLARGALKLATTFGFEHDPVAYLQPRARDGRYPVGALVAMLLCSLGWWALMLRAGRALWASRETAAARWTLTALGSVALTHAVFLGADRYHLVVVPLLVPWAVGGSRR